MGKNFPNLNIKHFLNLTQAVGLNHKDNFDI